MLRVIGIILVIISGILSWRLSVSSSVNNYLALFSIALFILGVVFLFIKGKKKSA